MSRLFSIFACSLLLNAAIVRAQDAVPIASVQIVNAPDIRNWPATATITGIHIAQSNMRVDFTKRDGPARWPDITPPGFAGPIEYTVWLFLNINGQWVGSGFIQMWNGRDGVGDAPSDFAMNWYYGTRWSPMQTHGPIQPGEQIGILVTSGNARDNGGPYGPSERSNLVLFPAADQGDWSFATPPPPVVVPVVTPPVVVPTPISAPPVVTPPVVTPPAPVPAPAPQTTTDLSVLIAQQATQLAQISAKIDAVKTDLDTFEANVKTKWDAFWSSPYVKYGMAALAGLALKFGITGTP
jgi:hypothetical protein